MPRYQCSQLNKQQAAAYTEYFVEMKLTSASRSTETEVDDRGIDFVTRYEPGPFMEVQVKSLHYAAGARARHTDEIAVAVTVPVAVASPPCRALALADELRLKSPLRTRAELYVDEKQS